MIRRAIIRLRVKLLCFWPMMLLLIGCASWAHDARTVLQLSAQSVNAFDASMVPVMAAACPNDAELEQCYRAHHFDTVEHAILATERTHRAAEAAVDAAVRAGSNAGWLAIAACVAVSVGELVELANDAGFEIPPDVRQAVETLRSLGASSCTSGGT